MSVWSPQQDKALIRVGRWLENPGDKQLFRLFGYAGTGKTTLAKHLAQGVAGHVIFAAYTGKAASVLRRNGAGNAQTLHSLIYTPKERSKERYSELKDELEEVEQMIHESRLEAQGDPDFKPRRDLTERIVQLQEDIRREERNNQRPDFNLNEESPLRQASLLVVDECSMVDEEMAMDIMSFGKPVLVLGDPEQLPPVRGTGYFTDADPDIMLTEIHRQARDNPIIDLATRVRNGDYLRPGAYGESAVVTRATPEMALASDQVLVGRNRTRLSTNHRMRNLKGFAHADLPLAGEKLVCLRNDKDMGLLNGTLHYTTDDALEVAGYANLRIRPDDFPDAEPLLVPAHLEHFNGDPDEIGYWERRNAQEFTYGYALTVHKSQGSQWGRVLIINEADAFRERDTARKWLYTAITRAADAVTIVGG